LVSFFIYFSYYLGIQQNVSPDIAGAMVVKLWLAKQN